MDGAAIVCCGSGLVTDAGLCIVDLDLRNAWCPVLMVGRQEASTIGAAVIPFPSLFRGGPHYGETLIEDAADQLTAARVLSMRLLSDWLPDADFPLLSELLVDLSDATGAERIFYPDVRAWLRVVFGVEVHDDVASAKNQAVLETLPHPPVGGSAADRRAGLTLRLSCDSIPSLSILALRRNQRSTDDDRISFITMDPVDNRPRALLTQPSARTSASPLGEPCRVPTLSSDDDSAGLGIASSVPTAISFRRADISAARLFIPVGGDLAPLASVERMAPIRVLIAASTLSPRLLYMLASQSVADRLEIRILDDNPESQDAARALAKTLFPERVSACDPIRDAAAEGLQDDDFILELDGSVTLHDLRTLQVLADLASEDRVASAGCLIIELSARGAMARPVLAGRWSVRRGEITAPDQNGSDT